MVSNAGTITASASGATESATAYGIYIDDELEGVVDNSGTITATATGATDASATGIYLSSTMLTGAQLTNSGTVSATAVTTESGDAEARGVYIYEMEGATFTNTATGNIAAQSTSVGDSGEATGLEVDQMDADSTIINQGTITAVSEGGASSTGLDAFGMHIDSPMSGTISSSGSISATATSMGSGPVEAYGILIHNTLTATGSVDNSGTISVSASGVAGGGPILSDLKASASSIVIAGGVTEPSGLIKAAGIYVYSGMEEGSTLTNSGTITATAAGPDAEASGIRIDGSASGALVSSGDINVTGGEGVGAHGILINSTLTATGSVENTGNISVVGPGGDVSGTVGIYVWSMDSAATLSNSGTITASPVQGAFSLYVEMGNAASISNSGRLDGGLYLNGASLASSGTVAIPVGVSGYIGGDYTQSAGGVFEVGVLSSSEGGYGQLTVDGTADLSASNQLAVNVSANDMLVDEEVIEDVLSAGTLVTGEELTVSDNSTLWDFTAVNDGLNNIDLGVIRGLFIADAVRLTGPAWALGAATSLDAIIEEGPQGDMATVIGEMGTLSTPEQVSAAAAQTVPVLVAQSSQMANLALNTITDAAINRNYARKGMASGDELMSDQHLWVKPFGSYADQDERDGVPGFNVDNYGLVIGYDQGLTDAWTVGGAIGYSDASVKDDSDLIDHKLDVKSVQLAAYADWQIDQDTFLDIIGVVGGSDNDSKRVIRFADIDRTADGSYDSWYGRLYAGVGRNFAYDKLTLTPVISATYSYLEDDSYTETGADSLNLKVDDNDADSFVLGIDGRLSYALNEQDSRFTAHVGAGYDTISDTPALTSTFVGGGPAFTTEGAKPDQVVYQAGVGLEFHATDQVDVYINYEYEGREDFSNQLAVATVRWAF
jgi:outer membrane autotransporter protein